LAQGGGRGGAQEVAGAPTAADAFSGTNVQEASVDEADLVKSDGRRLFALHGELLLAIDIGGSQPRLLGELRIGGGARELLLRGDRLLVIGDGSGGVVDGPVAMRELAPTGRGEVRLTEVAVGDPAAMRIARTLDVPGAYVTARLTGGEARVVVTTAPDLPVATSGPVEAAAHAAARAGLRAFVPRTRLRSRITHRTFRRPLAACREVRRPARFSGLDLLTVLTVDLDRGLYSIERDAILAGAQVVYETPRSLYVASQRWVRGMDDPEDVPATLTTEIHRFDAAPGEGTRYAASGSVPGFLLNQFAMSEHRGALRVASTREPTWLTPSAAPLAERERERSESMVSVLRERAGRLAQVGRIDGLGRGERIYAVRFIGDAGYVVTFRQVDPLYTLDLSEAERPRVAGELEITGYSAYLHPLGDGLLLGVGQDATEQGLRLGAQASLFDVRDPAAPRRLAHLRLGTDSSTQVEGDHRAFLWWAPTRTAVLPVDSWSSGVYGSEAIGLRAGRADGLREIGRLSHGGDRWPARIRRSFVVGGRLYTLSDRGVASARLDSLQPTGFLSFPPAADGGGVGVEPGSPGSG
ncbi:MAG: beta-propeller domain-containing protein, partial [Solirubrobacteraceae bacterium]|nr:beta-propeller domain-containing protein [Solirubrobacteraceae bacterium]